MRSKAWPSVRSGGALDELNRPALTGPHGPPQWGRGNSPGTNGPPKQTNTAPGPPKTRPPKPGRRGALREVGTALAHNLERTRRGPPLNRVIKARAPPGPVGASNPRSNAKARIQGFLLCRQAVGGAAGAPAAGAFPTAGRKGGQRPATTKRKARTLGPKVGFYEPRRPLGGLGKSGWANDQKNKPKLGFQRRA